MEAAFYILMVYYTGFILALGIAMHNIKKYKTEDNPIHAALLSWVILLFIFVVHLLRVADWAIFKWRFGSTLRRKRGIALKAMLKRGNITGDAKELPLCQFYFCWIKTFVCLLLNRTGGSIMRDAKLCIITHSERCGYEGISWDSVWVSPHFFKDWNVALYEDGC